MEVLNRRALLSTRTHFMSFCCGGHSAARGTFIGRALGDAELELDELELDEDQLSLVIDDGSNATSA